MKKIIIFFILIFSFADVSDVILKIKAIQNFQKKFLIYPKYNIFININNQNINYTNIKLSQGFYKMKIYAIFNNKVNINGKWKKIGDFINDYKIIKIYPDYVILKKNNKLKILKITSNIIKVSK